MFKSLNDQIAPELLLFPKGKVKQKAWNIAISAAIRTRRGILSAFLLIAYVIFMIGLIINYNGLLRGLFMPLVQIVPTIGITYLCLSFNAPTLRRSLRQQLKEAGSSHTLCIECGYDLRGSVNNTASSESTSLTSSSSPTTTTMTNCPECGT